ncbi:MAG: 1,4-alpha-glucan branching enzyme, partial [Lachnospiraceae bacterium]|nr:1,4-alpha-glucan branching enzyme [Lachnospiraceae bacterium]
MDKVLYDLMDWAGIEELVYSEAANPERLLGAHLVEEGLLIQALIPSAAEISVKLTKSGRKYPMEKQDDAGFFAVLVPRKTMADYTLLVTYDGGSEEELQDPYTFPCQYTESDLKKFEAGIHYEIYKKMGAHPMT